MSADIELRKRSSFVTQSDPQEQLCTVKENLGYSDLRNEIRDELKNELENEMKDKLTNEIMGELRDEIMNKLNDKIMGEFEKLRVDLENKINVSNVSSPSIQDDDVDASSTSQCHVVDMSLGE